MPDTLSIRAYTPVASSHEHDFHQIVLPLQGVIEITVDGIAGVVGAGQIVIIQKGVVHSFRARQQSRFLVADLDSLPHNARLRDSPFASVSPAMQLFCDFAEAQLQHGINIQLEQAMVDLFRQLLSVQKFVPKIDNRLSRVLSFIEVNLHQECSLEDLASIANLSTSHFKSEFKRQMARSTSDYLTMRRMEKARALLTHTDLTIQMIAERVGYTNPSAFTRRFSNYFNTAPTDLRSR